MFCALQVFNSGIFLCDLYFIFCYFFLISDSFALHSSHLFFFSHCLFSLSDSSLIFLSVILVILLHRSTVYNHNLSIQCKKMFHVNRIVEMPRMNSLSSRIRRFFQANVTQWEKRDRDRGNGCSWNYSLIRLIKLCSCLALYV